MNDPLVAASKLLSLVLRHRPDAIGISLDANGWVEVEVLLERLNASGNPFDRALLERIVATSDKQRFALSDNRRKIRANQGHSVAVELALPPAKPPAFLFHGTASQNLPSIQATGLVAGSRHDVHLSVDPATARKVGARHGRPVVLRVSSARMQEDGYEFRVSANQVWLVAAVPPEYLEIWEGEKSRAESL